jgi:hypothetical protein
LGPANSSFPLINKNKKIMKTESKSILQKMKELQDKTITNAESIKGGTLEEEVIGFGLVVVTEENF